MFSEISRNNDKQTFPQTLSKDYPYVMRYEFTGKSGTPSFSSEKPMPTDSRAFHYSLTETE